MKRFQLAHVLLIAASLAFAGCDNKTVTGDDGTDAGGGNGKDGGKADAGGDAPPDANETTAMVVGAGGGTLTTPTGLVLEIPAGAVGADTMITITRVTHNVPTEIVSELYEIGPDGTQLAVPARLTIPYDVAKLGSLLPSQLTVGSYVQGTGMTGTGWSAIAEADHTASAFITHFSQWAIVPNPPGQGCQTNYGCVQTCSGSMPPELCCNGPGRRTCHFVLHGSFPSFASCYAGCIGTPNTTNFGNSRCLDNCCTGQGFTAIANGVCYKPNATFSEVQAVIACGRTCFGANDYNSLCGGGDPTLDACTWSVSITPDLGEQCTGPGQGVNGQHLATDVLNVYDQIWGLTPVIHITSGSLNATSISAAMTCANGMPFSGTFSGTWNGSFYSATWAFGAVNGNMGIQPAW